MIVVAFSAFSFSHLPLPKKEKRPLSALQRGFRVLMLGVLFLILGLLCLRFSMGHLFFVNHSPSAVPGIYVAALERNVSYHKGDFVVASDPYDFPEIGIYKGALFLKQVRGLCGDTYRVTDTDLVMDGVSYPINHTFSYLPHQKEGLYSIHEGEVLLLNDYPYSLDSRYFGPVPAANVKSRVSLLVSFETINQWLYKLMPDVLIHLSGMDQDA